MNMFLNQTSDFISLFYPKHLIEINYKGKGSRSVNVTRYGVAEILRSNLN